MQGRDNTAAIVGAVLVTILLLTLLGGGMMGPWMMGWGYYGWGGFWWMWIVMAVFWVLVIGGVVWLIAWIVRQGRGAGPEAGPPGGRALDILRERYARGEITREQYEQMRQDLEGR